MTLEGGFGTKLQFDRVFFIVDRTRLKDEKDELKNAIVVYIPEKDLSKPQLEQRCSQLVGISILVRYFVGSLPKFIRLKSFGFAIRELGNDLLMGLQSKFDEPKGCTYQLINRIHDFFCFYYSSPSNVMKMAVQDWEIFTTQMNAIFHCILEFTLKEGRSLPSMFNPVPYVLLDPDNGGTQLYMRSQRLLRQCQLHDAIIGGCIFYEGEILCSQLPPDIGEMFLLAASGGIELNSRSILEDQLAPESVWIINVFLTSEQLALTNHLRRRNTGLKSMYAESLKPNPNLESEIQAQQKYQNSHIERSSAVVTSSRQKKEQKVFQLNQEDADDFVTISYGSDSVSFTKKTTINPLKRSKIHGKRTLDDYESVSENRRCIFDPLPPLPPSKGGSPSTPPPPIPPRVYGLEDSPPTIPSRKHSELAVPTPPPRKGTQPPEPPPRLLYKNKKEEEPPAPPPRVKRGGVSPVPPLTKEVSIPLNNKEIVSPGIYTTPSSSFNIFSKDDDLTSDLRGEDEGSDMSEGYRTPPLTTPIPDNRESSLVTTSLSSDVMSQSFFTPGVLSPREGSNSRELTLSNGKDDCHVIEEERVDKREGEDSLITQLDDNMELYQDNEAGGAVHQKGVVINPNVGVEENHYEFDQYPTLDHIKKMSTSSMISNCSDDSLVITKAVSEIFNEERQSTPEQGLSQQEEGVSLYVDGAVPHPNDLEDSMVIPDDHSPIAELLESASEGEDTVHDEMFMASTRQGGAPLGTILSPTRKRKDEPKGEANVDQVMYKKCLYVQKCVNTVVAILADEDLPSNSALIKDLWTTLLSWIVVVNNSVEPCLKDQDSIYQATDGVKESTFKAYHAGYSANIGMCEVSSVTAPYQFRHAVRRVHQEYGQDPSLRQVSLLKDHCKIISQNVLGREVFYHCNRVGSSDALLVHSLIEKQVKQASKLNVLSDTYTANFL